MDLLYSRIDLGAIARNVAAFKAELADAARLLCVVKADAYNHGVARVVPVMEAAGADAFGVATFAEAAAVRAAGATVPVLAWIWSPEQDVEAALRENVALGIPTLAHARAVIDAGLPAEVFCMVETGMHRAGLDEADWREAFELLASAPHVRVLGLSSHLAAADDPADPMSSAQAEQFRRALTLGRELGLELPLNHLANTPGTLTRADLHFEQVRVGLGLYGLSPFTDAAPALADVEPALTWAARITMVKPIAAGESTSYSHTWVAPHDGYLAVVPCGYADGLPRLVQGHLEVGVGGVRYPQVGRVCMDQCMIFLGANERGVVAGDEAVIFGAGGMSAAELARATGTIGYEVLCWPGGRTVREYVEPGFPASGSARLETDADMRDFGERLGASLQAGDVVILDGPLGAGKTTLTQGLARGLGVKGRVTSPTFQLVREHRAVQGGPALVHVDAYRLLESGVDPEGALDSLDIDSDLDQAVVVAEWGKGLFEQLASRWLAVHIDRTSALEEDPASEARIVTWRWEGTRVT